MIQNTETALLRAKLQNVKAADAAHRSNIRTLAAAAGKKPHQYLNDLDPRYKCRAPWPTEEPK